MRLACLLALVSGCVEESEPRSFAQSDSSEKCDVIMDLICTSCVADGVATYDECSSDVNCEAVKRDIFDSEVCIESLESWSCGTDLLPFDCQGILLY